MALKEYFSKVFMVFCLMVQLTEANHVLVKIENGYLIGKVQHTILRNISYYAFKGIPYAEAPIGPLRFQAPQPISTRWFTRNALQYGNICIQTKYLVPESHDPQVDVELVGDEDCLSLDVFTPELPKKSAKPKLKAVMVWIHGGGYNAGSGHTSTGEDGVVTRGPDFLLEEDVIFVTVNYRLGVFGFLTLGNIDAPGNYGLKDQIEALRWVKKNIKHFGGDPDNVTIFGLSAGSGSTSLLMVSPLAKGLFHKVVCQSLTVVNAWAVGSPYLKKNAFLLGKLLGLETKDPKKLLEVLRVADASELVRLTERIPLFNSEYSLPPQFQFAPTVEPVEVGEAAVITKDPEELLRTGQFTKLPVIIGHTSEEGLSLFPEVLHNEEVLESAINNLVIFMPVRGIKVRFNSSLYEEIANEVRSLYHLNERGDARVTNYIQYISDFQITLGVQLAAEIHSEVSDEPLFFYRFSYDGGLNKVKLIKTINISGTNHADELCYQFRCSEFESEYGNLKENSPDFKMIKIWSRSLTNFAKTGNPTPIEDDVLNNVSWLPRTSSNYFYLKITDDLRMAEFPQNYIYKNLTALIEYIKEHQDSPQ